MYYLETNALRILCNKLGNLFIYNNCFTSILSIVELLSGISDNLSYNQRKGIIRKVLLASINVEIDLPETKVYKAYGISLNNNDLTTKILEITQILIKSVTLDDFLDKVASSQLSEYWKFLQTYDEIGDIQFKKSFKQRQNIFEYTDSDIPDFVNKWEVLSKDLRLRDETLKDIIAYYAEIPFKKDSPVKVENKNVNDLINNYDHSLDIYLLCSGYFSGTKIIYKNAPSRNDYFDLHHLAYLNSKKDTIVSNDDMLRRLLEKFYPSNYISILDFEKLL